MYRPVVPVYARFLDWAISAFQSISRNSEGHVESVQPIKCMIFILICNNNKYIKSAMPVPMHWLLITDDTLKNQWVTDPVNILQTEINILVWKDSAQKIQKANNLKVFWSRKSKGYKQDNKHLNKITNI